MHNIHFHLTRLTQYSTSPRFSEEGGLLPNLTRSSTDQTFDNFSPQIILQDRFFTVTRCGPDDIHIACPECPLPVTELGKEFKDILTITGLDRVPGTWMISRCHLGFDLPGRGLSEEVVREVARILDGERLPHSVGSVEIFGRTHLRVGSVHVYLREGLAGIKGPVVRVEVHMPNIPYVRILSGGTEGRESPALRATHPGTVLKGKIRRETGFVQASKLPRGPGGEAEAPDCPPGMTGPSPAPQIPPPGRGIGLTPADARRRGYREGVSSHHFS